MNSLVAAAMPGTAEMFVMVVVFAVWAVVPVLVVIWFARKVMENKRENVRLRLEVGKLADELEQVRKQQTAE